MKIELDNAEDSGRRFSQIYESGELAFDDSELRLIEKIAVAGQVRRKSVEVELRGELHTRVAVPCGRCLKEVELPIDVSFAERFAAAVAWRNEEQHELSEEDLNLGVVEQAIDLDDLVREEILLALPAHALCNENCRGLCPTCGADLNAGGCSCKSEQTDSRWEKLKELRF